MVASGFQFLFGRFGFLGYNNYVCLFYFYYHRLLNAVKQYCNTFKVKKMFKTNLQSPVFIYNES